MVKLFEIDSYLKEFETNVVHVDTENRMLVLEDTSFYARSGGQPGDTGVMEINEEKIRVLDTIKKNDSICHIVEDIKNIKIDKKIKGIINWNNRYKYMKMHSALHLMCSIIPMDVTGNQIGLEKSRIDFNDPEKKINKEEVEKKLNLLIDEDHKITYEIIDSKILKEKPEIIRSMSVKPPEINGKIRLIRIGNIDLQPCGGTHVKSTIEIGKIKIGKIENKGKMNRRVNITISD
tara:strand:- start:725 stop:1426 length:702 start_codon:yes stop_codon:yes gene_type:complete